MPRSALTLFKEPHLHRYILRNDPMNAAGRWTKARPCALNQSFSELLPIQSAATILEQRFFA